MNTFTNIAPFGAITTYAIVKFFNNVINAVISWNNSRVTRNALRALSDRELEDIGVKRSDIDKY